MAINARVDSYIVSYAANTFRPRIGLIGSEAENGLATRFEAAGEE